MKGTERECFPVTCSGHGHHDFHKQTEAEKLIFKAETKIPDAGKTT